MKARLLGGVLLAGIALSGNTQAGTLIEAIIHGQALQYMDGGNVSGCGVRVIAVEVLHTPDSGLKPDTELRSIDGSFTGLMRGYGMLKAYHTRPTAKDIGDGKINTDHLEIKHFWFKAPGHPATQPRGEVVTSDETKHALIYAADLGLTMELINAVSGGEPIQIGFQGMNDPVETILYGAVQMSEGDMKQLATCLGDMSRQIKEMVKSKPRQKRK